MIDCPLCKGSGHLDSPRDLSVVDEKKYVARLMREQGHSFRSIMKALKYKSPASVQYLLHSKKYSSARNYNQRDQGRS